MAPLADVAEDDRLVQYRHVKVKPTAQQTQQIERLVTHIEKTLKQVSDHFHESGMKVGFRYAAMHLLYFAYKQHQVHVLASKRKR